MCTAGKFDDFDFSLLLLWFDMKKSPAKTHQAFLEAYNDAALSYPNCRFWF